MSKECDHLIDYVNDQLTPEQKAAFMDHLTSCSTCKEEVEELQLLMADLPYVSEPVEPPADLKERVLAKVFEEEEKIVPLRKKKRGTLYVPALAAALFLSIIGNVYLLSNNDQVEVQSKVLQTVSLAPTSNSSQAAFASIIGTQDGQQNLVIQASNLKELRGEEVYQVWLIDDKGPIPTGAFTPDNTGAGTVLFTLNEKQQEVDWAQVAISVEPDATSQTPEGEVILAGKL